MGRPRKIKAEHIASTQAETARNAGVSRQAVHKSRHMAMVPGGIDVQRSKDGLESIEDAQRRKETALADKHQLDAMERAGELVEVSEVEMVWANVAQVVKEQLMAIPDALAGDLAAITDARMVRDMMQKEIRAVLGNLPEAIRAATDRTADQPAN